LLLFLAGSLKEFGSMLQELSGEWKRTIERAELQLVVMHRIINLSFSNTRNNPAHDNHVSFKRYGLRQK